MKGRKKGLGKRIAAYLLTLAMVISMVGFQAGTVRADGTEGENGASVVEGGNSEAGGSTSGTEVSGTEESTSSTEVSGTEGSTSGTEVSGTEGSTSGTEVSGTEESTAGTEVSGIEGNTAGTEVSGTEESTSGTEVSGADGTISGGEDGEDGDDLSDGEDGEDGEGGEATLLSDDEDETESESWNYRYNRYEVYQLRESELNAALADVPEGYKWVYVCLVEQGEGHYDLNDVVCSTEAHTHNDHDCYTQVVSCGITEHTHTDNCYGRKLVCELGEHTHDESCYGLVKTCTKHDHEEAGEVYKSVDECNLKEHTHTKKCGWGIFCDKKEHKHQEGVCYGYVVGQKLNCKHQVLHLFQNLFDWEHPTECYDDVFCTEENHTHTDKCYKTQLTCTKHVHDDVDCYDDHALLCGNEEHTHTADCYTDKLICEKEEHQHSVEDGCYRWVEGDEALYNCMLVAKEDDGMAELGQGNEKFSYTLTVTCKDGLPAVNSKVTVTLKDFNPFAKYPTISRDLYTGIDGKIQLDYSGTYDRITSVLVDDKEILTGEIKVGYLQNRYYEDDYQLEEHEYVEVEGTAVDPTIYEEGKTADQKCKHCGVEIKGEAIGKLTSYKVSFYMLKNGVALPDGTISSPTKNWINMNTSILVENDPEGSTTSKDVIEKVLGSSEEILKPYEQTFEYNGTVYTYAKAEVFRIMKESDYDKVGYHADCRMIRGYSEGEAVPYADNDIFVLYVDEDGTYIDKGYISAQNGEITVSKSLDETYNKVHHGKNYIFSNWIDEDGNVVEVNGTVSVGDKKVIVLTAGYVEKPLARFFLLYKDKNEEVPSENVGDATTKYTNRVVTGALTKGVVTYENEGVLAIPEEGYTTVEDYIKTGPTEDEINLLLSDAGYTAEEIERYGYTIDWFRTMSYDNEEFYHVDGRVISTEDNIRVTVIKKEGNEFVGSFWVEKNSSISANDILSKYSGLQPAEGYTLSWENADGSEYVFDRLLDNDTTVYAVYSEDSNEGDGSEEETPGGDTPGEETPGEETPGGDTPEEETPGGDTPSGDVPGGNTPGGGTSGGSTSGGSTSGGSTSGGSTSGGSTSGGNTPDGGTTEIPDEDTPLSPEPDDKEDDTMDDVNGSDSSDEEFADIDEGDVPLSDGTGVINNENNAETLTIEDEATPLSDNPLTGDSAPIAWAALAVLAAFGLTASFVSGKRKKED